MADTVLGTLKRLFPDKGPKAPYWHWQRAQPSGQLGWYETPPLVPFDAFAAAAYLLEISGAYHHIVAEPAKGDRPIPQGEQEYRRVIVKREAIAECRAIAKSWQVDPFQSSNRGAEPPTDPQLAKDMEIGLERIGQLATRWRSLFGQFGEAPIFIGLGQFDRPPSWWTIAHEILMIADEACVRVGFNGYADVSGRALDLTPSGADADATASGMYWFEKYVITVLNDQDVFARGVKSLSSADYNVACVLPKARTTPVGCTLRSLSHHLSLLPPQGIARGRWRAPQPGFQLPDDVELNLLLIPFPFSLDDDAFKPAPARSDPQHNLGFFDVFQQWLPGRNNPERKERLVDVLSVFVTDLATEAKARGAVSVDGIVFPELALDYEIFCELAMRIKYRFEELELFVAGMSTNELGRNGNFVGVLTFPRDIAIWDFPSDFGDALESGPAPMIREKHHRWKLDRSQLSAYKLDGALNPKLQWWENIDLLSRRVDFTAFRQRSVMAAMICEDLARVDPCQSLLRSVGPNLVIALLMDAPQRVDRWPSRYATILAEDPGCSVLTFTSRALMTRQHNEKVHKSKSGLDRIVGLWKDDFHGESKELHCPQDCQGIWLKLWSSPVTDYSLDGRDDPHGKTWVYGKHVPLKLAGNDGRYPTVLGDADRAAASEADAKKSPGA